MASLGILRSTI